MSIAVSLHLLAAVIWVGGMFFAHQMLRPVAATLLEPPLRQPLWIGVFERFFLWVWLAIFTLLSSGYWMLFGPLGGFATAGVHVHIMNGLGLIMIGIYLYVFFGPYRGLRRAVADQAWPVGKAQLDRIRTLVGINMTLGLITIVVGAGGRYLG
jgi:uncharacterized membrane protein